MWIFQKIKGQIGEKDKCWSYIHKKKLHGKALLYSKWLQISNTYKEGMFSFGNSFTLLGSEWNVDNKKYKHSFLMTISSLVLCWRTYRIWYTSLTYSELLLDRIWVDKMTTQRG